MNGMSIKLIPREIHFNEAHREEIVNMIEIHYELENTRDNLQNTDFQAVTQGSTPSFSGIVIGECKGRLWLDDLNCPTLAIAQSYCVDSYAFFGSRLNRESYQSLEHFLANELFIEEKEKGIHAFEFSVESEELTEDLLKMFGERKIQKEREFSFRTTKEAVKYKNIDSSYIVKQLTPSLWEQILQGKIENRELIENRILESWFSFEDFYKKSLAYCVLHHNRIVAVIAGTARYKNVIPIDIETQEEERRKGLAYELGRTFIEGCLKRGYIPQWDCVESNQASYLLARQLGFEKFHENVVYWFDI